jgi:hypothetical protein
MDELLDDLLAERHHLYTVSQSMGNYGEYEADKAYIKLTTLKKAALLALRNIYKVASHTFHVYFVGLDARGKSQRVSRVHASEKKSQPVPGPGQGSGSTGTQAQATLS